MGGSGQHKYHGRLVMKFQAIATLILTSLLSAGCSDLEIQSSGDLELVQPEAAVHFKPTLVINGTPQEVESYLMMSSSATLEKDVAEMSQTYNQVIESLFSGTSSCDEMLSMVEEASVAWSGVAYEGGWLMMVGLSSAYVNETGGTEYTARDMESGLYNFLDNPTGDYVWGTLAYFHANPFQIMLDTWDDSLCATGGEGELWDYEATVMAVEYLYSRDEGSLAVDVGRMGFDAEITDLKLSQLDDDGGDFIQVTISSAHFSGSRVQEEEIVIAE